MTAPWRLVPLNHLNELFFEYTLHEHFRCESTEDAFDVSTQITLMALNNLMIGTAGEYLVAAQMNLRGWYTSLTMKNYPMIDIIGKDETTGKFVLVQVKTIH